jgi:molecular chaperone DnaK (HSP70)
VIQRTHTLIKKGETFPNRKSIKFSEKQTPKQETLTLKLMYSTDEAPYLKNNLLNIYWVSLAKVEEEQWTFALQFYLDNNGLPSLDKASINSVYYEDAPATTTQTSSSAPSTQTEEKKDPPQPEKKVEKVKKEKQHTCIIKLFECHFGLPQEYLNKIIQREASQENDDRLFTLAINKRNEIENFIYSTRTRLDGELVPYVLPEEKERLTILMNEMEQWLYSGSEDVYLKSALDEKVKDLNELGNKVYKRYHDWELLSESLNRLHNEVDKKQVQVNDSSQNTFLKPGDREEMTKLIHQNLTLHKEGSAKFEKGSRLADPPLAYQEVDKAIDEFSKVRLFFT